MVEEEAKEEVKPSFLEDVKAERVALEKVRDENKAIVEDMRNLQAENVLSGKADIAKPQSAPETTPEEYAKKALKGEV